MNCQKLLQHMVRVSLVVLTLTGCGTPATTPFPAPIGEVEPIPEGCLYMEFFSLSDDSAYKRDESGRISAVITPTNRTELLLEQWTLEEFEEAVYENDQGSMLTRYLPGSAAWEYLEKYFEAEDEIWTFGMLDTGFVIIRDGTVFCVVVTDHAM